MKDFLTKVTFVFVFFAFSIWVIKSNIDVVGIKTIHEAGLSDMELRELKYRADKNDTKAFERLETYYKFYVKDDVDGVVFFKKYTKLNNPKVNEFLAFNIRKIAFEDRVYFDDDELHELLKESLFYMKKAKSQRAKQTLAKYKNLNDEQIIKQWRDDIRNYNEKTDVNLLYRW